MTTAKLLLAACMELILALLTLVLRLLNPTLYFVL